MGNQHHDLPQSQYQLIDHTPMYHTYLDLSTNRILQQRTLFYSQQKPFLDAKALLIFRNSRPPHVAPIAHWCETSSSSSCSKYEGFKVTIDQGLATSKLSHSPYNLIDSQIVAWLRDALVGFNILAKFIGVLFPVNQEMVGFDPANGSLVVWLNRDFYKLETESFQTDPPEDEPAFLNQIANMFRNHSLNRQLPEPLQLWLREKPTVEPFIKRASSWLNSNRPLQFTPVKRDEPSIHQTRIGESRSSRSIRDWSPQSMSEKSEGRWRLNSFKL